MNRIYTRLGDLGTSALLAGERQPKHAAIFTAIGEIDELNAQLGICRVQCQQLTIQNELATIQHSLFTIGAQLASDSPDEYKLLPSLVTTLEQWIDHHWSTTPRLTRFILPGGTDGGSQLHLARTVARRAERSISAVRDTKSIDPVTTSYLNRLSDYLFCAARTENYCAGTREQTWTYLND